MIQKKVLQHLFRWWFQRFLKILSCYPVGNHSQFDLHIFFGLEVGEKATNSMVLTEDFRGMKNLLKPQTAPQHSRSRNQHLAVEKKNPFLTRMSGLIFFTPEVKSYGNFPTHLHLIPKLLTDLNCLFFSNRVGGEMSISKYRKSAEKAQKKLVHFMW